MLTAGCGEDASIFEGHGPHRAFVDSDPAGGLILVDGLSTRLRTPDTVAGLGGSHEITVRLDTQRVSYRYRAEVLPTDPEEVVEVNGPLVVRCQNVPCYQQLFRYRRGNRIRFATNPSGTIFLAEGSGQGLIWPRDSGNSYASGGMPMFAALIDRVGAGQDTVALGVYDTDYLAGRPAPQVDQLTESVRVVQSTWIVPFTPRLPLSTVRGLSITETVIVEPDIDDIIGIRLVFRNITDLPIYRTVDPFVPPEGLVYEQAYIGFALDADIGTSTDDLFGYDLERDLVFAYDARFDESSFGGTFARRPGLVGLTALEAPENAQIVLNGWMRQNFEGDWSAGFSSEPVGWQILSGIAPYSPDHPHPRIGHMPVVTADARIAVTAGPLTLAPGDSAVIALAVLLAEPVDGTFEPGQIADPGDPLDPDRPMASVAANLFARLLLAPQMLDRFDENVPAPPLRSLRAH